MVLGSPYLYLGEFDADNKDRRVAIVRGGRSDGKIVYLNDGTRDEGKSEDSNSEISAEGLRMVDRLISETVDKMATNKKMRERMLHGEKLRRMFRNGIVPKDEKLRRIYDAVKAAYAKQKNREIDITDGRLEVLPETQAQREVVYVAAPAGSGKSYWCRMYARGYNCFFPDNQVNLFSKVEDDPSLDDIENLVAVPMDENIVDAPIELDEMQDCLCIFDDTDTIRDREISNEINHLKDDVMECGRHQNIHCLITSHLLTSYSKTRTVLNEAHKIVVYPKSGAAHQIGYCLKTYCGFDPVDCTKLLKQRSRWCCVARHFPQHVITESKVYLVGDDDGDAND